MGEELAVLAGLGGAAGDEAAAVDPDHDGKAAALGVGGGPDVEGEAIFAGARVVEDHVGIGAGLDAVGAEVVGGEGAVPLGGGLRGLPAEVADRRRGVGDSLERADLAVGGKGAFDFAFVGFDRQGIGGEGGGGAEGGNGEGGGYTAGEAHGFSRKKSYHGVSELAS